MIPIVNDKYQYIIYYCPKSACSFIRKLFYDLHHTESPTPIEHEYHNLNVYFPYVKSKEPQYKNYKKIIIVRNPYDRVLSMYYNKVLVNPLDNKDYRKFISKDCETFTKFITKLQKYTDATLDIHFRNQMFNPHKLLAPDYIIYTDNFEPLINLFRIIFFVDPIKLNYVLFYFATNKKINFTNYVDYKKDMSSTNLVKHTNKYPCLQNMMSPHIERLIYNKYKLDFDTLKFPRYYNKNK
jgi:hypothetical protein